MAKARSLPLLVVDGYNAIYASDAYLSLLNEPGKGLGPAASRLTTDPFDRAREALLADVASFAAGSFEAVIVYDGARNLSTERADRTIGGVRVVFSRSGQSADSVIEQMVTEARDAGRPVTLVTSDNTIRATVAGVPVSLMSSALLAREVDAIEDERESDERLSGKGRMALEDRLSPESRAALDAIIGRVKPSGSPRPHRS